VKAKPIVIIPAYRPSQALPRLVSQLTAKGTRVLVVDDGSGPESVEVFDALRVNALVTCVRHAVNLGKGAALRTGINYALAYFGEAPGLVTADADGQHLAEDILAVSDELVLYPDHLILGARSFEGEIPFRSRVGNVLTRGLVRAIVGLRMRDTQTGLRGIPTTLARELLHLTAQRYEFELDMLILSKHLGIAVREVSIATVYEDGNPSSHFQPLRDSMKIGFVLFRFALLSALTSLLDNVVFAAAFRLGAGVIAAQALARGTAMFLNYFTARKAVFISRDEHTRALPRYLLLVVGNGFASYVLLTFLHHKFGAGVVISKIAAELALFAVSFALQRDFVFTRNGRKYKPAATDWDAYYRSVFPAAHWTRRFTTRAIQSVLRRLASAEPPLSIIEFGGANSCLAGAITSSVPTKSYYAADLNRAGLEMLKNRADLPESVSGVHADVLRPDGVLTAADVVMSVGLIEHFDTRQTRTAIQNHFRCCKPGGLVILSYPTPTAVYRIARCAAELVRMWRFPDERPLRRNEVYDTAARYGALVEERLLWPLVFTQRMMIFRKAAEGDNRA
jgi:glycosyltransferase involved in cell wall biosynthesis